MGAKHSVGTRLGKVDPLSQAHAGTRQLFPLAEALAITSDISDWYLRNRLWVVGAENVALESASTHIWGQQTLRA